MLEGGLIETAQGRTAIAVGAGLAVGVGDDPAIGTAHGQHQHLQLTVVQQLVEIAQLAGVGAVGDQQ
ncbi:hypothetical protein D3C78_1850700 [compost metagenome]